MKQLLGILLFSFYLAACAGNPPAWWNPGNRYGQTPASAEASADQGKAPRQPAAPQEENMDPLPDNSYEEEVIAPLPEEEDTPAEQPTDEPGVNTLPVPSVLE